MHEVMLGEVRVELVAGLRAARRKDRTPFPAPARQDAGGSPGRTSP